MKHQNRSKPPNKRLGNVWFAGRHFRAPGRVSASAGGAKTLRRGGVVLSNDRAKRAPTNRLAVMGPHSGSKAIHRAASTLMRRTVDYSQINHHNRLGSSHAEWHE